MIHPSQTDRQPVGSLHDAAEWTDAAFTRRLATMFGDRFRWCAAWGEWLLRQQNGSWSLASDQAIEAFAKKMAEVEELQLEHLFPSLDFRTARRLILLLDGIFQPNWPSHIVSTLSRLPQVQIEADAAGDLLWRNAVRISR